MSAHETDGKKVASMEAQSAVARTPVSAVTLAYYSVTRWAALTAGGMESGWVVYLVFDSAALWVGGSAVVKIDNATAECLVAKMVDVSVALVVA